MRTNIRGPIRPYHPLKLLQNGNLVQIVLFDCLGNYSRVKDYLAIGSGASTGGLMLLDQFYSSEMNTRQAMRLAAYVIQQVGSIDQYVSGLDHMKLSYMGKASDIKDENYAEILEEAKRLGESFKQSWLAE
ncbi:MAG: hypothetical protein JRN58_01840 [Nitrososphaerota archaeon]|nr:hypothetical protein [Nitrososphaerota archaeon]